MILSLAEVKLYLAIDFEDDDLLLSSFSEAAELALKQQTGRREFVSDLSLAKLYCLAFVKQVYDNRGLTTDVTKKDAIEKLKYTMKTILLQLSLNSDEV